MQILLLQKTINQRIK